MSRSRPHLSHAPSKSQLIALCALLIAATAFGGGGSRYGIANLIVQFAALIAVAFHRAAFSDFLKRAPLTLKALVALCVLLPSLFLVPLPPEIWGQLPGRDLVAQSHQLTGGIGWTTASVDPVRTLLALSALITPIVILVIGLSTRRDQLITIGWIVVMLGIANLLIGIVQVLSNGTTGLFYPENPMPGVLFGTFANRNSAGLFLVGCLGLAALLPAPKQAGRSALPARVLVLILLLLAIFLTRSRTAVVLSVLPLAALALRTALPKTAKEHLGVFSARRASWTIVASAVLLVGALAVVGTIGQGRIGEVAERFQDVRTDARTYIWEDAEYSARRFWPVGSGIGTFDDVFQIDESLENITQRRAGRAHNDYLEVAIEAGIFGLSLVLAWLIFVAWLSFNARHSQDRWIAWSGSLILAGIALQSLTDYPLRNHTILALAAIALVLLLRFGASSRKVSS